MRHRSVSTQVVNSVPLITGLTGSAATGSKIKYLAGLDQPPKRAANTD